MIERRTPGGLRPAFSDVFHGPGIVARGVHVAVQFLQGRIGVRLQGFHHHRLAAERLREHPRCPR